MKIQSIPLQLAVVILTAGVGSLLLFAYGNLGPKTEPPNGRSGLAFQKSEYDRIESMLTDFERTVLTLSRCPPQPLQNDEARRLLREAYGEQAPVIWSLFYDDALDDPDPEHVYSQEGFFLPLIYHQGIQITEAYRVDAEIGYGYEVGQIVIREEYTGTDPLLKGFWRESVFWQDSEMRWIFDHFNGEIHVQHPQLFSTYLPLKEEYQWM